MLIIPGTDVHWGDPVNTASKLGQDVASGGQLLISAAAHDELLATAAKWAALHVAMQPMEVVVSKVILTAYDTSEREHPLSPRNGAAARGCRFLASCWPPRRPPRSGVRTSGVVRESEVRL